MDSESASLCERETIVQEFHEHVKENGSLSKADQETLLAADSNDIARFAISKQRDYAKAATLLLDSLTWRKELKLDEMKLPPVSAVPINVRGYKTVSDANLNCNDPAIPESFRRINEALGGGCHHKWDKDGNPLYIERLGYHDCKKLAKLCSVDEIVDFHVNVNEFMTRVLMKERSDAIGKIIDKHVVVFDCTGMGLHQFHMPALNILRSVSELDQKHYPERMSKIFLVNAPYLFWKAWSIIKAWLDPRTAAKVHILGKDYSTVLLQHIEADSLPVFLGGSCTCDHIEGGCVPMSGTASCDGN